MATDLPATPPTPAAVAKLRVQIAQLLNEQQANYWKTVFHLLKHIAYLLEHPEERLRGLPQEFHDRHQNVIDQHWKIVDLMENRQREIEDVLMKVDPTIKWGQGVQTDALLNELLDRLVPPTPVVEEQD